MINIPLYVQISGYSQIVPFLAALLIRRTDEKAIKVFSYLIIIAAIVNFVGMYFAFNSVSHLWLYHIYQPIEFAIFVYLFREWETVKDKWHDYIRILIVAFMFVDQLLLEDLNKFGMVGMVVQSLVTVTLASRILWVLYTQSHIPILSDYRFYITAGTFLFFGINSISYVFINLFHIQIPLFVHSVSNISTNLIFAYSFICYYKRKRMISMV
ncbi:MAG: hypothetical protein KKG93_17700 [Bacteroidetes bacterium]|nr:hypothetical protein [Bacteroidota bacterium]